MSEFEITSMHLYPQRRNVAAHVVEEELKTVTYATPPVEERRKKRHATFLVFGCRNVFSFPSFFFLHEPVIMGLPLVGWLVLLNWIELQFLLQASPISVLRQQLEAFPWPAHHVQADTGPPSCCIHTSVINHTCNSHAFTFTVGPFFHLHVVSSSAVTHLLLSSSCCHFFFLHCCIRFTSLNTQFRN